MGRSELGFLHAQQAVFAEVELAVVRLRGDELKLVGTLVTDTTHTTRR